MKPQHYFQKKKVKQHTDYSSNGHRPQQHGTDTRQEEDDQLLKYENCKPSRSPTLPLFPVFVAADFPLAGFKIAPDVGLWQHTRLQMFLHMNMFNAGIHKRFAVGCKS